METKFLLRKDRSTHSISIISMGPNLRSGCMPGRLLAGYRLFTTRIKKARAKLFFDFLALKVFYVKTKAKMLKISVGLP